MKQREKYNVEGQQCCELSGEGIPETEGHRAGSLWSHIALRFKGKRGCQVRVGLGFISDTEIQSEYVTTQTFEFEEKDVVAC